MLPALDLKGLKQNGNCVNEETSASNLTAVVGVVVAVDSETVANAPLGYIKRQPTSYVDMCDGEHTYNNSDYLISSEVWPVHVVVRTSPSPENESKYSKESNEYLKGQFKDTPVTVQTIFSDS